MAKTLLEQKSKEIKVLDETTRELLASIEHRDRRRRFWSSIAFCALLLAISLGIFYQYSLAAQNKNHIDCIIKDLSTPLPTNKKSRVIDYQTRLSADCKIKFN